MDGEGRRANVAHAPNLEWIVDISQALSRFGEGIAAASHTAGRRDAESAGAGHSGVTAGSGTLEAPHPGLAAAALRPATAGVTTSSAAPAPVLPHTGGVLGAASLASGWVRTLVTWLPLAIVVGAAFVLRLWRLGAVGFNSDEAVYSGQAAALFGDPVMSQFFSVFRAHPLALQVLLGGLFEVVGISDVAARTLVATAFGVGTVVLTYLLARRLFGSGIALVAAAVLSVAPYHVVVSRQVLVDTPFAFFVVLTMLLLVRWLDEPTAVRLAAVAGAAGMATITKETGVLLLPVVVAAVLATGRRRALRPRAVGVAIGVALVALSPFVISRVLLAPSSAGHYLLWQVSRPPNHAPDYFLQVLAEYGSPIVLGLVVAGAALAIARRSVGDVVLLAWVAVFAAFFQLWPTKLFPYLSVIFPALCTLGAVGLFAAVRALIDGRRAVSALRPLMTVPIAVVASALCLYLGGSTYVALTRGADELGAPFRFDIEVQDFAGGREAGWWVREHTPSNAVFLTIGPSMGNLLRFYGHRESVALSVSVDPRRRNPAYVPVRNPDLLIRRLGVHYAVWDFYSADRSGFYNGRLMRYVRKYDGRLVFGVYETAAGRVVKSREQPAGAQPLVLVYDLAEGPPFDGAAVR